MSNISLFQTKYTTIENIENLSKKLNEPNWLLERRKDAFSKFNELPYDPLNRKHSSKYRFDLLYSHFDHYFERFL